MVENELLNVLWASVIYNKSCATVIISPTREASCAELYRKSSTSAMG